MGYLDYYEGVEGEVRRIEESDELREEDRELLLDFKRDMKLQGVSESYLHSLLVYCRKMTEKSDKGLAEVEEDELKDIIEWVEDRDEVVSYLNGILEKDELKNILEDS